MKSLLMLGLLATLSACGTHNQIDNLEAASIATPPKTVTLVIKGYRPQAGNAQQNLFASNFSVNVSHGQLALSTARDGMADTQKSALAGTYGFDTSSPESAVANFADLLLFNLGLQIPQQALVHCGSSQSQSSSNDAFVYNDDRISGSPTRFLGLRDCEKVYMGLNPAKFDNAGNGIPDYLKLRCGLNTLNANDAYISTAGDGVANIDKCKRHIPIDESAFTEANQLFAYQYATQNNADGTTDFTIANIPVLNDGTENFIGLFVTEISPTTSTTQLSTAYLVLPAGHAGRTIQIAYWAKDAAHLANQQIVLP